MAISDDIRKRNTRLAIASAAVILFLLFFGLKASGVLKFGQQPSGQVSLNAQGVGPDSTLGARATGPAPTLSANKVTMPQDVFDWLNHLARIEKMKQALTGKQLQQARELQAELGGASGLTTPGDVQNMSDPDYNSFPTIDKATAMLNQLQPDWVKLKKDFDAVPPPAECKNIAEAYDSGLENIISMFETVEKMVGGTDITDPDKIRKSADDVRNAGTHHRRGIDGEFESTDDLVQSICDKYDTKKWFKIDAHGGTSGLMGY